jgi:hypothetical protein
MRAGVTVATGEGDAGLRNPQLGPHDMHNPLPSILEVQQFDAKLVAVPLNRRHHFLGEVVGKGPGLVVSGNDVIDSSQSSAGEQDFQAAVAEHLKRLWTGHFVDQVLANEQLRLP